MSLPRRMKFGSAPGPAPGRLALALSRRQGLEPADALLDGRMGGEEAADRAPVQRVDDEHMRRRRVALGGGVVHDLGAALELAQRAGEPEGIARDLGPGTVGLELAGAADGE